MTKTLENPCPPNCPERSSTCHGQCKRYKIYAICNSIIRSKRNKASDLKNHDVERFYRCLTRARKWRQK